MNWTRRLRELREAARGDDGSVELQGLLEVAEARGFTLDWVDIAWAGGFRENAGFWLLHPVAVEFIARYAESRSPASVLDPWASDASLLGAIAERACPHRALGLVPTHDVPEMLVNFTQLRNLSIEWKPDAGIPYLDGPHDETFDLVVCAPPWISERKRARVSLGETSVELNDDLLGQFVIRLGAILSQSGQALVVASDRFIADRRPGSARSQLGLAGLHVRAVVALGVPLRNVAPTAK